VELGAQSKRLVLFASKLGYQTRSFEEAVGKLSVEITYVTDRCHQLDDPWGDRAIPVHFESPGEAAQRAIEALRGQRVDGVLALGDRAGVAAAYFARGVGVRYNHPAAVEACRSKLRMREIFRDAGLWTPWFRKMGLRPTPEPALLGISYPCVLKPLSLSASQGVIRANNREEFMAAWARVRQLLESPEVRSTRDEGLDQMIVEGYIPGREVAVEGLLSDGVLRVLAIFDKPDPLEGPFFEETIYTTPSRLSAAEQEAIERCAADCVRAVGLLQGPIHAEFRINEEGVWPLEVAPRPIGGLCARALRFARTGEIGAIGLEELLLRRALDLSTNGWLREERASGVMMIPVPESGMLERIEGEDAARETRGVTELLVTARLHDYIAAWPEGASYLGFIFSDGETADEADKALREAHGKLRFHLTPRLPVERGTAWGIQARKGL
jgi:biotin carboxylase